ncbi:kinase-like domain-containing protein [Syncephalis fuscata]|nr:kinase-like domain-containing protein [Syncephalis fuscata]
MLPSFTEKAALCCIVLMQFFTNYITATPVNYVPMNENSPQSRFINFDVDKTLGRPNLIVDETIGYGEEAIFGLGTFKDIRTGVKTTVVVKCSESSSITSREIKMHNLIENRKIKYQGRKAPGADNIVNYLDVFKIQYGWCFVTEYAGYVSLYDYAQLLTPEEKVARLPGVFSQINEAMGFYHLAGMTHNDITPESKTLKEGTGTSENSKIKQPTPSNKEMRAAEEAEERAGLKVAKEVRVTLIDVDLGRALTLKKGFVKKKKPLNYSVFMPPEAFLKRSIDLLALDKWQLGACLYTAITGMYPFEFITNSSEVTSVTDDKKRQDLIKSKLTDQMKKMAATKIVSIGPMPITSSYGTFYKPLLTEMDVLLSFDPNQRYKASSFSSK